MPNARRSRLDWSKHVAAWRSSNQSSADYARRHGLNPSTFAWWRWRLNRGRPADAAPFRLVPVREAPAFTGPPIETALPSGVVEIALPSGVVVKAPSEANLAQVAKLVRALVDPC